MDTISKQCFKCELVKPLSEFYRHPQMADGHLNKCIDCSKAYIKEHREKNLERIRKEDRDRYAKDPEPKKLSAKRYQATHKEQCNKQSLNWGRKNREKRKIIYQRWRDNNPGYITQYDKERVARDPGYAMMKRLRVRLRNAVRAASGKKASTSIELIGCSPAELVRHIEALFLNEMSWDNRDLWHIDHIRPCANFDLTDPAQQKICFHYTNLQPLWGKDNLQKGTREFLP